MRYGAGMQRASLLAALCAFAALSVAAESATKEGADAGRATPVSVAAASAATPLLVALAQAEAAGTQPEGQVFAGQFRAGQTLEQPLLMLAGKCYTVVAAGVGVEKLEVKLVVKASPFLPPLVLAKSDSGGPSAVIGGKSSGCIANPQPISGYATVVVTAVQGAGIAATQVLAK